MSSTRCWIIVFIIVIILFFAVGLPLIIVLDKHLKNPTFTVESSRVKALELTSDNHLFCILEFSVRTTNPNSRYSLSYYGIDLEVRKGKHHKLADDVILDRFDQGPRGEKVVNVEAVGLYVELKTKVASEVRAELDAGGETRVNIFMTGGVSGGFSSNDLYTLKVACKDVGVDFSRSTAMVQSTSCRVKLIFVTDGTD